MSQGDARFTRRQLFGRLFSPLKTVEEISAQASANLRSHAQASSPGEPASTQAMVAVIAGRHCLAYQNTPCSICHERCPVPGALPMDGGLPRVVWDLCTGCGICHDVCPSPDNAVRLVPAPPGHKPPAQDNESKRSGGFPFLPDQNYE